MANSVCVGLCTLVSAGFFQFLLTLCVCYLDIECIEMMIVRANVCIAVTRIDGSGTLYRTSSLIRPIHDTTRPINNIHLTIIAPCHIHRLAT